jgi:Domain of unknown function (DUF1707)
MNTTQDRPMAGQMRASDADRDAVVATLSESYQAGRLTADEFDERTGRALTARTLGELSPLTSDLPGTPSADPGPVVQQAARLDRGVPIRSGAVIVLVALVVLMILSAGLGVATHGHHGGDFWWLIPVGLLAARRLARGDGRGPGPARRSRRL